MKKYSGRTQEVLTEVPVLSIREQVAPKNNISVMETMMAIFSLAAKNEVVTQCNPAQNNV